MDLCKEGRDWAQLVAFFEGLRDAGRRVKGKQVEMVVRRCCDAGRGGVVVEMLQRVERTGVRLGDLAVCREVMRGLGVERAVQGAFGEEAVGEAARWVEGAWVMLSEERHVDQGTRKVHGDPKIVPDVVGIVLWARALRSMLLDGMKDEDGKVKRGAEMLLAVWQRFEPESDEVKDDWRRHQNNNLIMWTPVWHGMKMARKILGETTPLGRDLRTVMTRDLEPLLENASKVVSENSKENGGVRRRGLTVYNELSKIATEESSTPTVDSAE